MDIFQQLNAERGITVLLITHEHDIAEYGTRTVAFRDGRIVSDTQVAARRMASDETGRPAAEGLTMRLLMTLRIAFKALFRNKLRSSLTMLGMIIGVAAVIAMVALGQRRAVHHREPDQVRRDQPDLSSWPATSRRAASGRARVPPTPSPSTTRSPSATRCRACSTSRWACGRGRR